MPVHEDHGCPGRGERARRRAQEVVDPAQGQDVHRETEAIDKMRWKGFLATTIVALLAVAAPAAAETFVVNTTSDLTGPCGTTCSLRQAIVSAEQNGGDVDEIRVPQGNYALGA